MTTLEASTVDDLLTLLKDSWNLHDMVTYTSLFAADAFYVNAIGQVWRGHAEIQRGHISIHSTIFKDSAMTQMTNRVQTVAPGVALVASEWEMTGSLPPDGWIMHHPRQGILTLVLVEREGRWWIVAGQNTEKKQIELRAA